MAKSLWTAQLRTLTAIVTCAGAVGCAAEPVTSREPAITRPESSLPASPSAGTAGSGSLPNTAPNTSSGAATLPDPSTLIVEPDPSVGQAPDATQNTTPADDCGSVTQMAEARLAPADIVWVIDGSGSMKDEQAAVQQNITRFASTIAGAGIDHHVVMVAPTDIAMSTPLGSDPATYLHVNASVDSHNALSTLLETYPQYATFLRDDASLHFVVVTDDDSKLSADVFRTQMEQLTSKAFHFHAIASEDVNGLGLLGCTGACGIPLVCGASRPGREYYALADATGGQKISICTADWSQVFEPLQEAVIQSAPLPCEYALPAPPVGSVLDPMRVNVEVVSAAAAIETLPNVEDAQACGDELAWYYDDIDLPTRIRMCPSACANISVGGAVQIQLGCETKTISLD